MGCMPCAPLPMQRQVRIHAAETCQSHHRLFGHEKQLWPTVNEPILTGCVQGQLGCRCLGCLASCPCNNELVRGYLPYALCPMHGQVGVHAAETSQSHHPAFGVQTQTLLAVNELTLTSCGLRDLGCIVGRMGCTWGKWGSICWDLGCIWGKMGCSCQELGCIWEKLGCSFQDLGCILGKLGCMLGRLSCS